MIILLKLANIIVKNNDQYRLKNINLSIYKGEKVALIGKSGAGKSTLISIANGSLNPYRGEVSWKGKNLNFLKRKERKSIGTLWQDLRLVDDLDVGQNINTGALGSKNIFWSIKNLLGLIKETKCISCLKAVGLPEHIINSQITKISGGQRQRVAIARLLRQEPEILLADEPLSNLDPLLGIQILKLLLVKSKISPINIPETCLISLHQPEFLEQFTRVIGLKNGEIVLDLPSKEVDLATTNSIYKT